MSNIGERLQIVINELFNGKKADFCRDANVSPTTLSNTIGTRQSKPSSDFLASIIIGVPQINSEWLLTGEGEMLKSNKIETNVTPIDPSFIEVPLIPIKAQAGYLNGFDDTSFINELPTVHVIADRTFHGKYRCFEVSGDSMDDGSRMSIWDGDVILCREVKRDLWKYKLHIDKWFFVINHVSGLLIKQIVAHDVENCTITCHSLNSVYGPDFVLKLDEVRELYNVIKITERNLHI